MTSSPADVKTVRTNAPISSAKFSAIMATESLDIPGNARLAVSFINSSVLRRERRRLIPSKSSKAASLGGLFFVGLRDQHFRFTVSSMSASLRERCGYHQWQQHWPTVAARNKPPKHPSISCAYPAHRHGGKPVRPYHR